MVTSVIERNSEVRDAAAKAAPIRLTLWAAVAACIKSLDIYKLFYDEDGKPQTPREVSSAQVTAMLNEMVTKIDGLEKALISDLTRLCGRTIKVRRSLISKLIREIGSAQDDSWGAADSLQYMVKGMHSVVSSHLRNILYELATLDEKQSAHKWLDWAKLENNKNQVITFLALVGCEVHKITMLAPTFKDPGDYPNKVPNSCKRKLAALETTYFDWSPKILSGNQIGDHVEHVSRARDYVMMLVPDDPALVIGDGERQWVIDFWSPKLTVWAHNIPRILRHSMIVPRAMMFTALMCLFVLVCCGLERTGWTVAPVILLIASLIPQAIHWGVTTQSVIIDNSRT